MGLRERFLDALIDGHLGHSGVVSRKDFVAFFRGDKKTYTGVFLSNSEMHTGQHSPTYQHFTVRVAKGLYKVDPRAISQRRSERHLT